VGYELHVKLVESCEKEFFGVDRVNNTKSPKMKLKDLVIKYIFLAYSLQNPVFGFPVAFWLWCTHN